MNNFRIESRYKMVRQKKSPAKAGLSLGSEQWGQWVRRIIRRAGHRLKWHRTLSQRPNLSPEQRASYEKNNYFDVKGGSSGKTYRIRHGRQMNIEQLDAKGSRVCGWCFLPQGGLVAGDCMLAQKTALELFETEALKVANRF